MRTTIAVWTACNDPSQTVVVSAAGSSGPTATTGLPNSVGTSTASLAGTVNPNGVATNFVFEFGTSLAFGNITTPGSAGAGTNPVGLTANLSGLSPDTTYYYRVVATNSQVNLDRDRAQLPYHGGRFAARSP